MAKKNLPALPSSQVPLSQSISDLNEIVEYVEKVSDGSIPEVDANLIFENLVPRMDESVSNFRSAVDRRINLLEYLKMLIAKIQSEREHLDDKLRKFKAAEERIMEMTKSFMVANPNLEFQGSGVKRLKIQGNGGVCPIEYKIQLQSISSVVDPTDVNKFPPGYLREQRLFVLDKSKFDGDVRAGDLTETDITEIATLKERGSHLRIS